MLFGGKDWDVYGNIMTNKLFKLLDLDSSIFELNSNGYLLFPFRRYPEVLNLTNSVYYYLQMYWPSLKLDNTKGCVNLRK